MNDFRCRLYLVTPPRFEPKTFRDTFKAALDGGDVGAVQLRLKDADDDTIRRACEALLPIASAYDVTFLMNDRPDLAVEMVCDGVHIGQQDGTYKQARALVGPNLIVGVTCHNSRHLAMEAGEQGADYVAFGAFYPTATKTAQHVAEPEILEWWSQIMLPPCVAIGGITVDNCRPLAQAGADMLAVVSGVWDHPQGPAQAVREFNTIFDAVAATH
ncbi:MAG: thiamine phosphate synthase [Rhodospirillales bacterium]|nr:thiamine phosphate synthase [Rhodospirillales bacterium]